MAEHPHQRHPRFVLVCLFVHRKETLAVQGSRKDRVPRKHPKHQTQTQQQKFGMNN